MKKIILGLTLATTCIVLLVHAADRQVTLASGANGVLTNSPTRLTEVVVTTGGSAATVFLYDKATAITNTINAAYSTRLSYTTNVITSYTNENNVISSLTNSGIWTYTSTVAAATNEATRVVSVYAPANSTVTKTVDARLVNGVSAYSSAAATLTITYR